MEVKNDKTEVLKILESAIRSEIDGYNFYLWASTKTKDPKGKTLFRNLAEDEVKHLKMLEVEYTRHGGKKAWREPGAEDVTKGRTFEIDLGLKMRISDNTKEEDALKMALSIEKDARDFYRGLAEKAKDHNIRKIFLDLELMEKRHLEMIRYQYEQATRSVE